MKVRFSFTLKILLPFLLMTALFFFIFLSGVNHEDPGLLWLSASGMTLSLLTGVINLIWLKKPLNRVKNRVEQLTRGEIPQPGRSEAANEIGDLERNLEDHLSNLRQIAAFSRSMATGDFTGHFEKLSDKDELGEALLSLKASLMDSMAEAEYRRKEEEIQTWSAQGLAKFSSLFREAEDNLQDLSKEFMKELVGYTEADVGALFVAVQAEDEKSVLLDLFGSYAFDREKHIQSSFALGEGLVGRAALEKELIYITDLPPGYIKIRSGLGEDVPSSILLIPVLLDDQILGVIELASLREIPVYQIEFVRQLSEALATTLAKVQVNLKNKELFEQTKKQAEALASQEKIFRENLARLEKVQHEYQAREKKLLEELGSYRKTSN